jgi:hypothetical protein
MTTLLQIADATMLLVSVALAIIVLQRDFQHAPFMVRAPMLMFMFFAFAQAMWLLGEWVPGAGGFPLPRLALDASIVMGLIARVHHPLPQPRQQSSPPKPSSEMQAVR